MPYLFFVETDCEPDDVLALYFLTLFGTIHTVVFGESQEPHEIADSGIQFLKKLGVVNFIEQVGLPSGKHFAYRGLEHPGTRNDELYEAYKPEDYVTRFKQFVIDAEEGGYTPVYVGLKPPRELVANVGGLYPYLTKVTAIVYGGFNFRTIIKGGTDASHLIYIFSCFKKYVIYESFLGTGSNNSVNPVANPSLFDLLSRDTPFFNSFRLLEQNWNRHMTEDDCYPTCRSLLSDPTTVDKVISDFSTIKSEDEQMAAVAPLLVDKTQTERFVKHNLKPLLSIRGFGGRQFLLADQCAVLAFFSEEFTPYIHRCEISFSAPGYTVAKDTCDETVNTFCFKDIPRDRMISEMEKALKINNQ